MRITVIENGSQGWRLAKILSRDHDVRLLVTSHRRPSMIPSESCGFPKHASSINSNREVIRFRTVNSVTTACRDSDFIFFTSPDEFDGSRLQYNAFVLETTLIEALNCNANAAICVHSRVPVGFSDHLVARHAPKHLVHMWFTPDFGRPILTQQQYRLTLGGDPMIGRLSAHLLQRALNVRFRGHLVLRRESEGTAEVAGMLTRTNAADMIAEAQRYAADKGISSRILLKCLGLITHSRSAWARSANGGQSTYHADRAEQHANA